MAAIDQAALDKLKDGIAIDGVLYGAIEATIDRVQGANVWLTVGLREGKNREVKRVLAHLGLDTNRLIRISYGPFQLGDLKDGEVREIRGRILRDQLGAKLAQAAGADFEAPIRQAPPPADAKPPRRQAAGACASSAVSSAGGGSPTPRSDAIRPSSDRLRQTLFDILAHGYGDAVDEARVLDTVRRHRRARPRGAVARRASRALRRGGRRGARPDPRQHRVARADGQDPHLPARRDAPRRGRHRRRPST